MLVEPRFRSVLRNVHDYNYCWASQMAGDDSDTIASMIEEVGGKRCSYRMFYADIISIFVLLCVVSTIYV